LRFVYDEPTTMRSAGILGHDAHTGSRDESRPAADEESSDDGHTDTREERSDHGHTGPRDESRPAADEESSAADHEADLDEEVAGPLRSGHWDPAALRWVPDEPETSSVGRVLDEESTQDTGEGSATQGVDPSVPFDPNTTPTSVEGTAAAPFNVDSTSFEGSTARGFDPSGPLDRADPNLQSLDTSLFDLNAPGPTLDPALFDETEPGPTLDPRLFDSNAPGPTLDPALFDLNSPGPTVDPALFDERAPGPTLDPGLLDHDAPGPTLDANRLDPSAPGDTLDEAQLERASERPNSVAEQPDDVKGRGDTDPRAMEEPAHPEPTHPEPSTTPRHDDHDDPLDVG
jgi:hypothetical protein